MKIKILFVTLGLILSLTIFEVYARLKEIPYTLPNQCFKTDEVLNHTHLPSHKCPFVTPLWNNIYQINSLGLRDKEYPFEKPANTFRILVLGDSFTEGWGVDQGQAFPDQLESLLAQRQTDRKIEVLNAGVASYSPILEYLYLKEKGLQFNPDLVILAFDVTDFADEKEYANVTEISEDSKPISVKPFTPGHIQTYVNNLTNLQYNLLTNHSYLARRLFPPKPQVADLSPLYNPDHLSLQLVQKHIILVSELLSQFQVDFLLITYPYLDQLKNSSLLTPQNQISQFAESQKIDFLDFTEVFNTKDAQKFYLYPDPHLSTNGHSLIAQYLADYLIKSAQLTKDRVLPL